MILSVSWGTREIEGEEEDSAENPASGGQVDQAATRVAVKVETVKDKAKKRTEFELNG
jgi:hypothetical protein